MQLKFVLGAWKRKKNWSAKKFKTDLTIFTMSDTLMKIYFKRPLAHEDTMLSNINHYRGEIYPLPSLPPKKYRQALGKLLFVGLFILALSACAPLDSGSSDSGDKGNSSKIVMMNINGAKALSVMPRSSLQNSLVNNKLNFYIQGEADFNSVSDDTKDKVLVKFLAGGSMVEVTHEGRSWKCSSILGKFAEQNPRCLKKIFDNGNGIGEYLSGT